MLFQQIARNKRRTIYVMLGFLLLLMTVGSVVGHLFFSSYQLGLGLAVIIGVIYLIIMLSQSTNVVMALNHGQEITTEDDFPMLWHIVEDMAMLGRVPMPRIFIIADESPNAFATGPDPKHAAVAVTQGLLTRLNREELEGVLAHEISHIHNYDIRLQTTALALTAAISALVNLGTNAFWFVGDRRDDDTNDNVITIGLSLLVMLLAPLAAALAQMALSRNREYLADASGVALTRNPLGLIHALEKITASEPMTTANPASASLYIANPFRGHTLTSLFDTHPPTAKRIERLRQM